MQKRRNPNLYAIGKSLLADSMVVGSWWRTDQDWNEALKAFGMGALKRGVEQAIANQETVPPEVLQFVGIELESADTQKD